MGDEKSLAGAPVVAAGPDPSAKQAAPRRSRWARLSLSTQVLSALLAIASLGYVLTGLVNIAIQRNAADERIEASLAQEVAELRTLAEGTDPVTGQPFSSVGALLELAMERNIPNLREGFVATLNGQVLPAPQGSGDLHLERVEPLLQRMAQVRANSPVTRGSLVHEGRELQYVIVGVTVGDSPDLGVFAAAVDVSAEYALNDRAVRAHSAASLAALLLIASLGALAFNRVLRPLQRLGDTAETITGTDLSTRVDTRGPSDLKKLAESVNRMLDRLQAAFAGQKAMLDDVGHELRTPLTVIRGHLELMNPADEADVDETRTLVTDELDRMSRLIDDLVLIVKSEAPDFLRPTPTDVDATVESALTRARSLADRDWRLDTSSGLVVEVDEQRLTQALLQLASNAVRFTDPGDLIEFGTRRSTDDVQVWVRDAGEGIPAKELANVFNRFERGTSLRNRGEAGQGSGLGLSIVSAIARAHGGQVTVSSQPGVGSQFTITLPRNAPTIPLEFE